jgi:hypothetical protein
VRSIAKVVAKVSGHDGKAYKEQETATGKGSDLWLVVTASLEGP